MWHEMRNVLYNMIFLALSVYEFNTSGAQFP